MALNVVISPHGRLLFEEGATDGAAPLAPTAAARIARAFSAGVGEGLLHLGTTELQTHLPPDLSFLRELARRYLTGICHAAAPEDTAGIPPLAPPVEELAFLALQAPPMKGLEYLNAAAMADWWTHLDDLVRREMAACAGGPKTYLHQKNPLWRLVGRVTFHLAENKRDAQYPFAFMASYAHRLSAQAKPQHLPLKRALEQYAGDKNRGALVALLTPIQRASENSALVKELVESGAVYRPLAWSAGDAYRFLRDIPVFEQSGIIVRVPDWWKPSHPPRPQVSVRIGDAAVSRLGADALLDFSVGVTLEGQQLDAADVAALLGAQGGLVRIKGQWVEVDPEKLAQALDHWKTVAAAAKGGGISFYEGMRLMSGTTLAEGGAALPDPAVREWTGIAPGEWLEKTLAELRDPQAPAQAAPPDLRATLRPYQQVGVNWLRFMTRLGLGACLADDMGLGKTVQMIALLLHVRRDRAAGAVPSLLVVPASLIANWKAEIIRFAPDLAVFIAHPSEEGGDVPLGVADRAQYDLVITTYGMAARLEWIAAGAWNMVVLDEAQAIKNAGTRQARAVKALGAKARIALTGTPVENRLSDLWSLFDFLNPGLLGGAKAFEKFIRTMSESDGSGGGGAGGEQNPYGALRALVRPYILRRLKTDKRIIADLPDKTEVDAFCGLSAKQAALYKQAVDELDEALRQADGIQRRGMILATLLRLKQICNHPAQWLGDEQYDPEQSGKFERLRSICEELAQRQEKALVFTQFREITPALADYLQTLFGRPGLVLTGQTAVGKRRELVEDFQRDDGPPFFVLSLKAGGTGLNLTAACHVIHFDRWWNPAVENQATDRAFRIGQKRNVMVHKFICRGTVEEKIAALIADKVALSQDMLDRGVEAALTEKNDKELLSFLALDIGKASAG